MGVLANQFKREDEMRQLRRMASQNTGVPVTDASINQADANQLIQALPKNRQLPITPEQQAQIGLSQDYTPQPVQPMPPQRNTWNGNKNIVQNIAGGLQNVGTDIGNAVVNTVANAPQLVTGMIDSAKQNLTAEGLGNTLPALGRGALQAVDFVPGMAGLVASGINSFAGKDVIPMDNGWHNPVQYTLEQLKDKMDMQKRLQTPVVRPDARIGVAGDNYIYNGKTPNALSQYLVGANPGADKAQFAEDMVKFGAQMAMGGAGAKLAQGAIKASNLKKAENIQKTVEATKNAEQKAKYAKQLEKLKQAQQQAKKQNDYLQKLKDNTIFGGAVGLTEGENLEERLQSGLGASALGAGGTLAHVGLGKVAKSKPVKSVKGKITNKTNDFINKHHNVANAVGTLSSVMNTDVSSSLAKKYKGLNDVISRNTNLSKNLSEEQIKLFEKAKELPEEDSKAVIEVLKKGEQKRAEDIIKKNGYEINNKLKEGKNVSQEEINQQSSNEFDAMMERVNENLKQKQSETSKNNEGIISDAISNKKNLTIDYESSDFKNNERTTRDIVPLEIVSGKELNKTNPMKNGKWDENKKYLRAFCKLRNEERTFDLSRIKKISSESNLSEVKQEKGTNTPEEVKTPVKTQSDMSGEAPKKNAEGAYELKAELNNRVNKKYSHKDLSEIDSDNTWFTEDGGVRKMINKYKTPTGKTLYTSGYTGDVDFSGIEKTGILDIGKDIIINEGKNGRIEIYDANDNGILHSNHKIGYYNTETGKIEFLDINPDEFHPVMRDRIIEENKTRNEYKNLLNKKKQKTEINEKVKENEVENYLKEQKEKDDAKWEDFFDDIVEDFSELKYKDDISNYKVTKLPAGKAETIPLDERTSGAEDIFKNVRRAETEELNSFEGKKDALKDAIFFDVNSHKRVDALKPNSGEFKDNIETVKRSVNKNGKVAYAVRQLSTNEQKIREINRQRSANIFKKEQEANNYNEYQKNQQALDDYASDYENKVDNLNENNTPKGFHKEQPEYREKYPLKEFYDENATRAEIVRANEFIIFYDNFKKLGYNKSKQTRYFNRTMKKLSKEDEQYYRKNMEELANREVENSQSKKLTDNNNKQDNTLQNRINTEKNISSDMVNKENTTVVDDVTKGKSDELFIQVAKNVYSDILGKNFKGKSEALKDVMDRNADNYIRKTFEQSADKQKVYNKAINIIANKSYGELRRYSIKRLNKIADEFGVDKKSSYYYEPKNKYSKDYDELKGYVDAKDIEGINKILAKHKHRMHKYSGVRQRDLDVVTDAYYIKAEDYLNRLKNYKQIAKEKYDNYVESQKAEGKPVYEGLSKFEADTLESLKNEYDKLQRIIKNSYTDRNIKEIKQYNTEYGHGDNETKMLGTGDVWDREVSGIPEQKFESVQKEINDIFDKADRENYINRFKIKESHTVNDIPGDIVKKYDLKSVDQGVEYQKAVKELNDLKSELKTLESGDRFKSRQEIRNLKKKIKIQEEKVSDLNINNIGFKDVEAGVDIKALKAEIERLTHPDYKIDYQDLKDLKNTFTADDYRTLRELADKQRTGKAVTNSESELLQDFKMALEDYKLKPLKEAYGSKVNIDNYLSKKYTTETFAKAGDVIKGANLQKKALEVRNGYESEFIEGLLREEGINGVEKALDAVKVYTDNNRVNFDDLPDAFKGVNKQAPKDFYSTAYKPAKTLYKIIENETSQYFDAAREILAKMENENGDIGSLTGIVNKKYIGSMHFPEGRNGATNGKGTMSVVKYTNKSQLIRTSAHELFHRFVRTFNKKDADLVKRLTGLTDNDIIKANKVNSDFQKFKNSDKGKRLQELRKKESNSFTDEEKLEYEELNKEYMEFRNEYRNSKEEELARKFGENFERIYNERLKRNSDWKGLGKEEERNRQGDRRNRRDDGYSDRRGTGELTSEDSTQLEHDSKPRNESSKLNDINIPDDAKSAVKDTIDASNNLIEEAEDIPESKFKKFSDIKNLKTDAKSVYDAIKSFSDDTTDILIRNKSLTSERARNVLYKFDELGEGTYFTSYSKGKGKFKPKEALSGLLGHKKTYGKNADNALDVLYANAQRNLRAQHAERVVNYIKEQFGEKSSRGKSHPENYVPVNSEMLFNICFHKLSKTFYETINKGEKAIKETFKEDAPEILELVKATKKPDIYIPKEVLNKIFDGSGEIPSVFYKRYIKGRPLNKQTLGLVGKLSGLYLDTVNEQFKKMVLTTSSFFANNRLGNQIMLMARSDRLGDYVKGIYEAVKLKDNEVPKQLLESTLLNAEEMLGSLRRPSGWGKFDAMRNLLDGNMIDTAELKGMKKLGAQAANVCLGLPNKGWNAVTRALMKVNENFERFERKQVYSQTLSKAKRENVLTVAQKATAVKEFYKYLDQNKELSDYIIKKAEDVLGDYDNFSPAEKHIFKRLIPFYSWHRTIFRNTLHLIKENPTRAAILALKMYSMLNRDNGREEWQRGANNDIFGIKLPKGIVSNKSSVFPYMTILDDYNKARSLTPFASKSERGTDNPVGDLSPGIRIPVEALKGEKAFAPASEIQDPNWKRVTKDKKKGYFNKHTGKFVTRTPMSVRSKYVGRQLIGNTLYPALSNSMFKGLGTALTSGKGKFPDKVYDTTLGGFYDGDYIGEFEGKKKYRSARNNLPLGAQLATRFLGLGLQSDTALQKSSSSDSNKLKKKQQNYKNKRKK